MVVDLVVEQRPVVSDSELWNELYPLGSRQKCIDGGGKGEFYKGLKFLGE